MFGLSAGEILLIALIALLLFGNDKLPQNIKKFLKGWNQTKKVAFDLQKSWYEIKHDIQSNVELYDENQLLAENINQNHKQSVIIKPVDNIVCQEIVSQEEIDLHHNANIKLEQQI